jgi:ParB family chromosome partitioning protein
MLAVEEICLNPVQPRKKIEDGKLRELTESIRQYGVLQPVIVTRKDGLYHLVVGERRLRAARSLGLQRIPALVKEMAWEEMLKVALVENLQREDLGPLEEARSYQLLMKEYGLTQERVADAIGRSRPYVANTIRLLNLPREVMADLDSGELSPGHARVLLGLEDTARILRAAVRIKKRHLSVRQAEELVRQMKKEGRKAEARAAARPQGHTHLQESLTRRLETRVAISEKGGRGKIEIHFSSREEMGRIVSALGLDEEIPAPAEA